jgi:hypothetical protein
MIDAVSLIVIPSTRLRFLQVKNDLNSAKRKGAKINEGFAKIYIAAAPRTSVIHPDQAQEKGKKGGHDIHVNRVRSD